MGFTLNTCANERRFERVESRRRGRANRSDSAAQAEAADQRLVATRIRLLEIVEQLAALIDHLEQPPTGVMVARMRTEMLGEAFDARGQQCNLHLGRARVVRAAAVLRDDSGLLLRRE